MKTEQRWPMTVGERPHLRDKKGQPLERQHRQGGPASRNAGRDGFGGRRFTPTSVQSGPGGKSGERSVWVFQLPSAKPEEEPQWAAPG